MKKHTNDSIGLTNDDIDTAKCTDKAYKLFDGGGMYVQVMPNGSKYFRLDYRLDGKRLTLALGVYPAINLDTARGLRDTAKKQIKDGIKPSLDTVKKQIKDAIKMKECTTEEAMEMSRPALLKMFTEAANAKKADDERQAIKRLEQQQREYERQEEFQAARIEELRRLMNASEERTVATDSSQLDGLRELSQLRVEKGINDFTDDELQKELERRGWEVSLYKN